MKKLYLSVVLLVLAITSNHLFAQVNVYMKLTKLDNSLINGESQATNYANWVELSATGQGHSTPITYGGGTGNNIGKTTPTDFKFQTRLNAASLPLMALQYAGTRLKSVDIWYVKTGCNCAYYKIHMEDVYITSITDAYNDGDIITQEITFAPNLYAMGYYKQNPNGSIPANPTTSFGWDRIMNRAFNYSF